MACCCQASHINLHDVVRLWCVTFGLHTAMAFFFLSIAVYGVQWRRLWRPMLFCWTFPSCLLLCSVIKTVNSNHNSDVFLSLSFFFLNQGSAARTGGDFAAPPPSLSSPRAVWGPGGGSRRRRGEEAAFCRVRVLRAGTVLRHKGAVYTALLLGRRRSRTRPPPLPPASCGGCPSASSPGCAPSLVLPSPCRLAAEPGEESWRVWDPQAAAGAWFVQR